MNVLIKSSQNKNIKKLKQKQIVIFEKKTVFGLHPRFRTICYLHMYTKMWLLKLKTNNKPLHLFLQTEQGLY